MFCLSFSDKETTFIAVWSMQSGHCMVSDTAWDKMGHSYQGPKSSLGHEQQQHFLDEGFPSPQIMYTNQENNRVTFVLTSNLNQRWEQSGEYIYPERQRLPSRRREKDCKTVESIEKIQAEGKEEIHSLFIP